MNEEKTLKRGSVALVRIFSSLGGIIFGFGSMYFGNKIFGLEGMNLFGASLFVGFIGIAIGAAIGSEIEIANQNVVENLNGLWHYGCIGTVIWISLFMIILLLAFGIEGVYGYTRDFGPYRFMLFLFGIGLLGSLLICLMIILTSRMLEWESYLNMLFPIIVGLCIGIVQSMIFDIPVFFGIASGFLFPILLIPITGFTLMMDEQGKSICYRYRR